MTQSTFYAILQPNAGVTDPLHKLLRQGDRDLLATAVETELTTFLEQYADKTLDNGHRAVVRNGYLPTRSVQTGIGNVEVKVLRFRDRSADGINFSGSTLLPPYLKGRGLETAPRLATGDGALGFWKALNKIYPTTEHQRCWVHKTANVLNKLPKSLQPKIKAELYGAWMAETRDEAHKTFDRTLKHPKAMACLAKDREELLSFYDYPAKHWVHIRTINPIEIEFRYGPAAERAQSELQLPGDGLKTASERPETLEAHRALPELSNIKFQDGEQSR